MKKGTVLLSAFLLLLFFCCQASAQDNSAKEGESAGEFFGIPVPVENYYFVKSTFLVFGTRDGRQFKDEQEKEGYVWDQLLLSFEAFRRKIQVPQEELDREITKILEAEKAGFDRKAKPDEYKAWVKERINEPVELFENQIRFLLQIEKLKQQVMESAEPEVSDQEMHDEFLNEHNTLNIELAEFAELRNALEFYKKAKRNPKIWEEEKKKRPKEFRRPGFVSFEFLIDIWKIPRDTLYEMMKLAIGETYPPQPVYKGYAVFKVLEKRVADEGQYEKLKKSYYEQIKRRKRFTGFEEWFKQLKKEANIKLYKKEGGGR